MEFGSSVTSFPDGSCTPNTDRSHTFDSAPKSGSRPGSGPFNTSSNSLNHNTFHIDDVSELAQFKVAIRAFTPIREHEMNILSPRERACITFFLDELSDNAKCFFMSMYLRKDKWIGDYSKYEAKGVDVKSAIKELEKPYYTELSDSEDTVKRDEKLKEETLNKFNQNNLTPTDLVIDDIYENLKDRMEDILPVELQTQTFLLKYDPNIAPLRTTLGELGMTELRELLKSFKIKTPTKKRRSSTESGPSAQQEKAELINSILKAESQKTMSVYFAPKSSSTTPTKNSSMRAKQIIQKYITKFGNGNLRVNPVIREIFHRFFRIYFRVRDYFPEDYPHEETALLFEYGKRTFPQYTIQRSSNYFQSLEYYRYYENALKLKHHSEELSLERADNGRAEKCLEFYENEIRPRILEDLQVAACWSQEAQSMAPNESIAKQLLGDIGSVYNTATWLLISPTLKLVRLSKHYESEWLLLDILFKQRVYASSQRGSMYIRKAMIEEKYLIGKYGETMNVEFIFHVFNSREFLVLNTPKSVKAILDAIKKNPQVAGLWSVMGAEIQLKDAKNSFSTGLFQEEEELKLREVAGHIQSIYELLNNREDDNYATEALLTETLNNKVYEFWLRMSMATCSAGLRDPLVHETCQIALRNRLTRLKNRLMAGIMRAKKGKDDEVSGLGSDPTLMFDFSHIEYSQAPERFISCNRTTNSNQMRTLVARQNEIRKFSQPNWKDDKSIPSASPVAKESISSNLSTPTRPFSSNATVQSQDDASLLLSGTIFGGFYNSSQKSTTSSNGATQNSHSNQGNNGSSHVLSSENTHPGQLVMPRQPFSSDLVLGTSTSNSIRGEAATFGSGFSSKEGFKNQNSAGRFLMSRPQWEDSENSNNALYVEEVALQHYRKNYGYVGVHSENSMLTTLFSLLFWDIIFSNPEDLIDDELEGTLEKLAKGNMEEANGISCDVEKDTQKIPGVDFEESEQNDGSKESTNSKKFPSMFEHHCQGFPMDFFSASFYTSRKSAIELRLLQIAGTPPPTYARKMYEIDLELRQETDEERLQSLAKNRKDAYFQERRERRANQQNFRRRQNNGSNDTSEPHLKHKMPVTLTISSSDDSQDSFAILDVRPHGDPGQVIVIDSDDEVIADTQDIEAAVNDNDDLDDIPDVITPEERGRSFITTQLSAIHDREFSRQTLCIGVSWYDLHDLLTVANHIGPTILSKLMRLFATNYRDVCSGMPDLCLWKPSLGDSSVNISQNEESSVVANKPANIVPTASIMFVEVKSENDSLSDKQKYWIDTLIKSGLEVEVCKVLEPYSYEKKKAMDWSRQHVDLENEDDENEDD